MVAYIIGFILIIIALIIISLILRKRIYDRVDKLESWKIDIMNRNVSAELQRIKALRLSGETQTKFESWKETWDQILTSDLPNIEEQLFDAEEAADRFNIPSANNYLNTVEKILSDAEQTIANMYRELDELLDSEKKSRQLAEEVSPQIKKLRNMILHDLHSYGKAEKRFEAEISDQKLCLDQFHLETEAGNYYEASQIINDIKVKLDDLTKRIEDFPAIYRKCKIELPNQIKELNNGLNQMKVDGYQINFHNFQSELSDLEEQLQVYVSRMEETDDQSIFDFVVTIEERIQEIYETLEEESKARIYVDKHLSNFEVLISEVLDDFKATDEEVADLQKTYYLEENDLALYSNLGKWINQLEAQYQQINQDLKADNQSYVSLKEDLEVSFQDLQKLKQAHVEFKDQIRTIRKDELEAKEKIRDLQHKLFEADRELQKSNLPGIPPFIWNQIDEATDKCTLVLEKLTEEPLDMGLVNHALMEATASVHSLIEQTEAMIEQAYLIERVIQYANRYRSQNPTLASKLTEAEQMFRECNYEQALETASQSLEDVEPGALKRLETTIKVPS
ncbi:septation ring formation regulator EzrA [Amphibacillus sp. MSJ-3]|uniref:septation ring formation regulator EzrA n=1 Tax=Amphibacillus sp. MSJ-3 TaxID=2841505 RepID=UPI001C0EF47A|nr:septation ring formation regulator EzrA [Amphibacillus sp. MSJ-3]MBU5593682.1 septation ring formation regulator EzrA [Amphibacillus sp. MSJ-3]